MMPDDDMFDGHTFSIKGEVELHNVDFDTLHKLMNPDRIQDPDAAIYALIYLLFEYKKPLTITGDALRMARDERKLTIEYDKLRDIYTFTMS